MSRSSATVPSSPRGGARPVRRRTHTFRPNYLSFAGTYQCNLTCPHCCVPIEWPDRLDIQVALRFLEDAHAHGIGMLGFTGGEPFLYPKFVHSLCRRAAEASACYVSLLLGTMNFTSLLLYLPIGHLASLEGAAKKPFIGVTFVFFALFPLSLVTLGVAFLVLGHARAELERGADRVHVADARVAEPHVHHDQPRGAASP